MVFLEMQNLQLIHNQQETAPVLQHACQLKLWTACGQYAYKSTCLGVGSMALPWCGIRTSEFLQCLTLECLPINSADGLGRVGL